MPEIITGLKLSEGIGFGSIFISKRADIDVSEREIDAAHINEEISAYKESIQKAHIQLRNVDTKQEVARLSSILQLPIYTVLFR